MLTVRDCRGLTLGTLLACALWAAQAQTQNPSRETAAVPAAMGPPAGPSLAPMISRVTPGVVGISVAQAQEQTNNPLLSDPFFRRFFEDPQRRPAGEAAPEVRPSGSGVIINARDGLVLTNNHVVQDATKIVVVLKDRREFEARLVGRDPATDVALLRISADRLTEVPLGDSDALQVGDFVVAIGNPFGIGQTVTSGIVSALGRGISPEGYEDYIQTDAAINPGNSGGALVNLAGQLVGINTAILGGRGGPGGSAGNIGIGFAVPTSMAREVAGQIQRFGEVRRGRIGVQTQDVTPRLAGERKLPVTEGALVSVVDRQSPAETAGLKVGDIVVRANGRAVRSTADLRNRVALIPVDSVAELMVQRGAAQVPVSIKVGPITAAGVASAQGRGDGGAGAGSAASGALAGMEVVPGSNGLLARKVDPAGRAHALGFREGDVIVGVNRQPTTTVAELARALAAPGEEKAISVLRGETKLRIVIR